MPLLKVMLTFSQAILDNCNSQGLDFCNPCHFPKKYSTICIDSTVLLLLIFEQAEPANLNKIIIYTLCNLSSQSKEWCSAEAQSSGPGHTLSYDFTLHTFYFFKMSKLQINWILGADWACEFVMRLN